MKRKVNIFNLIAPVYGRYYNYQKRLYASVIDMLQSEFDLSSYKKVIDVGCGTGALCSVLHQMGFLVTGIDPAQRMLTIGAGKQENKGIEFMQASILERLPFEDKSFDISFASYVAHGLQEADRKLMYAEMSRITKHLVIFYDYNEKRSLLVDLAERLEGGDYFNFIKKSKTEMNEYFGNLRVMRAGVRESLYVCVPPKEI